MNWPLVQLIVVLILYLLFVYLKYKIKIPTKNKKIEKLYFIFLFASLIFFICNIVFVNGIELVSIFGIVFCILNILRKIIEKNPGLTKS